MVAAIVVGKAARDALALTHYAPQQITLIDLGTIGPRRSLSPPK
jgi:hypothetical protein